MAVGHHHHVSWAKLAVAKPKRHAKTVSDAVPKLECLGDVKRDAKQRQGGQPAALAAKRVEEQLKLGALGQVLDVKEIVAHRETRLAANQRGVDQRAPQGDLIPKGRPGVLVHQMLALEGFDGHAPALVARAAPDVVHGTDFDVGFHPVGSKAKPGAQSGARHARQDVVICGHARILRGITEKRQVLTALKAGFDQTILAT